MSGLEDVVKGLPGGPEYEGIAEPRAVAATTASSVAVNNLHLLRGMIGRPGAGILQMNGQPTAQNTRETGCDGEFPFFLNHQNLEHVARSRRPAEVGRWPGRSGR